MDFLRDATELRLELLCGESGLGRVIHSPHLNRPGLELTGCFDYFDSARIQIFGQGEMLFLESRREHPETLENLRRIFKSDVPCAIVSNNGEVPECVCQVAEASQVPLFRTTMATTRLYKRLYETLEHYFSPSTLIHGTLVDVLGMGVLLVGQAGIGKSECALELVSRGNTLIADDVVQVTCFGEKILQGTSPNLLRHYLEVRGLGIIDVSKLYGVRAIRQEKQIDLVISLVEWNSETQVDRVGLDEQSYEIMGVMLPMVTVPVRPGRNISTIVEVGARNHRLKLMGIFCAQDFTDRVANKIAGKQRNRLLQSDS